MLPFNLVATVVVKKSKHCLFINTSSSRSASDTIYGYIKHLFLESTVVSSPILSDSNVVIEPQQDQSF